MMIYRRATFFLGVFVVVIPFLGIPTLWKMIFTVAAGVLLMLSSVRLNISRKSFKPKPRKEKVTPLIVEEVPVYPHNDTIEAASVVTPTIQTIVEPIPPPLPVAPAPRRRRTTKVKVTAK